MNILVSGLVNIETSVPVRGFPVRYYPIDYLFGSVTSTVSGVGFNIAKALSRLGDEVDMVSLIGNDFYGDFALKKLKECGINTRLVRKQLELTCHSVVLYDKDGSNQIYCDLKDVQNQPYVQNTDKALMRSELAVLCNINFSRSLLSRAKQLNIPIATDCHVLSDVHDSFNLEFMRYADILFLSNSAISGSEYSFIRQLAATYSSKIIVIGMGKEGAMMYTRDNDTIRHYPVPTDESFANTSGAGDALFACFVHYYAKDKNPERALDYAQVFATSKLHSPTPDGGFLSEEELENYIGKIRPAEKQAEK